MGRSRTLSDVRRAITTATPCALLAAAASPAASTAATWVHFFDCGAGTAQVRHYSYDSSSLRRHGKQLLVDLAGDYSGVKGSRSTDVRMVWAIDCKARTFYEQRRVEYDAARHVVASHKRRTAVMPINPPGIAQQLSDRVCT